MKPVCVLRSNDICFTGILRSFGTHGIPVIPITFTWPGAEKTFFSESSKFFSNPKSINNPYSDPELAIKDLINIGKELVQEYSEKLMIIPSSDTNLMLLLDNFEDVSKYFLLMGSKDFDQNRIDIIDKYKCYQQLSSHIIETPKTYDLSSFDLLEEALKDIQYPIVFKPKVKDYGQTFYRLFRGDKAVTCLNKEELVSKIRPVLEANLPVIGQKLVDFEHKVDEVPFYALVDENHEIIYYNTAIKEYLQPHPYGTAILLRMTRHKSLLEEAKKVVKAIKWRGPLMIEFIKDSSTNKWTVIEINGRPWLMIDFYRRSGLSYLADMYKEFYRIDNSPKQGFLENSLHISLKDFAKEYFEIKGNERNIDSFNLWLYKLLRNFKNVSFTYYCYKDIEPGLEEIRYLNSLYGLDFSKTIEFISEKSIIF